MTKLRILITGDSITDAYRNAEPDSQLGFGYPLYIKALLSEAYIDDEIEIINRGISGDTIGELESRWQKDTLDFKPDIVSILIGINDSVYIVDKPTFGTQKEFDRFEGLYRSMLNQCKVNGIKDIVMMEPFIMPSNIDRTYWRKDIDPKIQIIRSLAQEYHATLVSLDGMMNQMVINSGCETETSFKKFTKDGVHPSPLGHMMIAKKWIGAVKPRINMILKRKLAEPIS